jgi:ribosomal protein S18 acetylase RimI-like enzyme
MRTTKFHLRETASDDYAELSELFTKVYPNDPPLAPETAKWLFERGDPERPNARIVAEVGGRIVGSGYLRGAPPLPDLLLNIEVDPAYRRRGIGTSLLRAVDAADDRRLPTLMMIVETDAGSLAFARHHGFAERDRQSESVLDLASFGPDRFVYARDAAVARGFAFKTMAEVDSREMRQRLFRMGDRVSQDMPTKDPIPPMTYDAFVSTWLEAPHSRPDLLVIGFDGDEPVAVSMVSVYPNGTGYNWMTGTMPAYRGQGLGLATKVEALRRAKAAGVTEVRTDNHERNAPMLAINRRLGYQTLPAIVWLVREP